MPSTATPPEPKFTPPPAIEKIKVKVDGREVEVPKTSADPLTAKPILTTPKWSERP